MLKIISINELEPGMMITQVIEQKGPVKIRKVGLVRSQDMITGLAEMGVSRIEVDLEQSVELEPVKVPTSMTQKLLQGEYDHASQVDKSLSDQFNRSLFLPSVSELPSIWQIYAKQVSMAVAAVFIGLSVGFASALLPSWLSKNNTIAEQAEKLSNEQLLTQKQLPSDESQPTEDKSDNQSITQPEVTANQIDPTPPSQTTTQDAQTPTQDFDVDPPTTATDTQAITPTNTEEGDLLTQSSETNSLSGVSPDLLERFNKALNELENNPQPSEPQTTVSVVDELPRVDQLPVLMLTQLPSMSFSAHMYSSNRETRWVRVNGKQLFEGEWIEGDLQLVNIEPQRVILSFRGELFTMAALTDW